MHLHTVQLERVLESLRTLGRRQARRGEAIGPSRRTRPEPTGLTYSEAGSNVPWGWPADHSLTGIQDDDPWSLDPLSPRPRPGRETSD